MILWWYNRSVDILVTLVSWLRPGIFPSLDTPLDDTPLDKPLDPPTMAMAATEEDRDKMLEATRLEFAVERARLAVSVEEARTIFAADLLLLENTTRDAHQRLTAERARLADAVDAAQSWLESERVAITNMIHEEPYCRTLPWHEPDVQE